LAVGKVGRFKGCFAGAAETFRVRSRFGALGRGGGGEMRRRGAVGFVEARTAISMRGGGIGILVRGIGL